MTWEMGFVAVVLVGALASFVAEKVPVEVTALAVLAILVGASLLPVQSTLPRTDQLLAVFSNTAPLTVLAMFVLSAALVRCGLVEDLAAILGRVAQFGYGPTLAFIVLATGACSAFLNNTAVVVIFTPVVLAIARQAGLPPSKLLIPVSFAAILGGLCTLLGTSTNILVSGLLEKAGQPALKVFELTPLGVPLLLLGAAYLLIFGRNLLPDRATLTSILSAEERREYLAEAFVHPGSPAAGQTLAAAGLLKTRGVRVLEIVRDGVALQGSIREAVLREGDRLILACRPSGFAEAQAHAAITVEGLETISAQEGEIVEGILGARSPLAGLTTREINFRQRYRVVLLAVHRHGRNLREKVDELPLAFGDTLLLMGTRDAIARLRAGEDILLLDRPHTPAASARRHLPLVLSVFAANIGLCALFDLPIVATSLIACAILMLAGVIRPRDAYGAVEWSVLLTIYGSLGLGLAMETTGAARLFAEGLSGFAQAAVPAEWQPRVLLFLLLALTVFLTEILSNNACAAIMTPIALGLAAALGLDPRPFVIAVCVGSSVGFAIPTGYQTNTFVYSVGGYRFFDFLKIGLPLDLLILTAAALLIPALWPLVPLP